MIRAKQSITVFFSGTIFAALIFFWTPPVILPVPIFASCYFCSWLYFPRGKKGKTSRIIASKRSSGGYEALKAVWVGREESRGRVSINWWGEWNFDDSKMVDLLNCTVNWSSNRIKFIKNILKMENNRSFVRITFLNNLSVVIH